MLQIPSSTALTMNQIFEKKWGLAEASHLSSTSSPLAAGNGGLSSQVSVQRPHHQRRKHIAHKRLRPICCSHSLPDKRHRSTRIILLTNRSTRFHAANGSAENNPRPTRPRSSAWRPEPIRGFLITNIFPASPFQTTIHLPKTHLALAVAWTSALQP